MRTRPRFPASGNEKPIPDGSHTPGCGLFVFLGQEISRAAPFHHGKACAFKGGEFLGRKLHRSAQRPPGHEDPQSSVRLRRDGEPGMVRVSVELKGDQIIGIRLHAGQPVNDKLIGLPTVQAQLRQSVLQECGGVGTGDAEALGEIICCRWRRPPNRGSCRSGLKRPSGFHQGWR